MRLRRRQANTFNWRFYPIICFLCRWPCSRLAGFFKFSYWFFNFTDCSSGIVGSLFCQSFGYFSTCLCLDSCGAGLLYGGWRLCAGHGRREHHCAQAGHHFPGGTAASQGCYRSVGVSISLPPPLSSIPTSPPLSSSPPYIFSLSAFQCCGSVTFGTDPDKFFSILLFEGTFTVYNLFKIKNHKEVTKQ